MHHDKQLAIRLPAGMVDRLDALVGPLAQDPDLAAAGRVTQAAVARLALARGLASLERSVRRRARLGGE
jgi:MoxR-like ATPase